MFSNNLSADETAKSQNKVLQVLPRDRSLWDEEKKRWMMLDKLLLERERKNKANKR